MNVPQILLLILILIGGVAVIGSYVQGFISHPGNVDALWGNITGITRSLYFISMIITAIGFFAFFYFIIFNIKPTEVKIFGSIGFDVFFVILTGILLFSSLWMPLTYSYVDNPNAFTWIAIRAVLILVGLSSCALFAALFSINTKQPAIAYWFALVGSGYFAFHTLVMDGLLWPALYR